MKTLISITTLLLLSKTSFANYSNIATCGDFNLERHKTKALIRIKDTNSDLKAYLKAQMHEMEITMVGYGSNYIAIPGLKEKIKNEMVFELFSTEGNKLSLNVESSTRGVGYDIECEDLKLNWKMH
jgi:hypothetical protein